MSFPVIRHTRATSGLVQAPQQAVSIAVGVSEANRATVLPQEMVFDIGNWQEPQQV